MKIFFDDSDNGVGNLTLQNSPPGATSVSFPLASPSCSGTGQLNNCCWCAWGLINTCKFDLKSWQHACEKLLQTLLWKEKNPWLSSWIPKLLYFNLIGNCFVFSFNTYFIILPEPIIRNDFVEEAETFIHSVCGHVLIQRLVVPGDDIDDDNSNDDEYMDVNDDGDDDASNNVWEIINWLACSRQEENHEDVRETVDPG